MSIDSGNTPASDTSLGKQGTYAVAVAFVFLYALSYFATEIVQAPLLWYFPLEQRWLYATHPGSGLVMGWYGKVLLSFMIAGLGAALLALGLKLGRRELGAALQGLLDLAAISMVVFVLYYIARSLAYRVL